MKSLNQLLLLCCAPLMSFGQVTEATLDANNINATLNDGAIFFYKNSQIEAGYEIPAGSGKHTVYAMSPWFGGLDASGMVRVCAQNWTANADQFVGPLSVGAAEPMPAGSWTETMFSVSATEIQTHLSNYDQPGYTAPHGILNWPAHGDQALGFDINLAPFIDTDQDGVYDPSQGDYPCIKGDQATYMIMNDVGVHASGSQPMGIEIHYMFYQYDADHYLGNTTFCNMRVINRGSVDYPDFRASVFADMDIGGPIDDYAGTDVPRNMVFSYNGDAFDEDFSNSLLGYQDTPPACGIVSLNHPIEYSRAFSSTMSFPNNDPASYVQFWKTMDGMYLDGTAAPQFVYPGDIVTGAGGDSEGSIFNPPGDRRVTLTVKAGELFSGEQRSIDFAIVYNRGADNIESALGLGEVADSVQGFYDSQTQDCLTDFGSTTGVAQLANIDVQIQPNPSTGVFFLNTAEAMLGSEYSIRDISGRIIVHPTKIESVQQKIKIDKSAGTYFLVISGNGIKGTQRILIE